MCGTDTAGFCLRSAVLSSPWTPGQELPAFVQASAGSRSPEVILLQACFSGYRASSGCRKMFVFCFAELQASCGASWYWKEWQKEHCVTLVRG